MHGNKERASNRVILHLDSLNISRARGNIPLFTPSLMTGFIHVFFFTTQIVEEGTSSDQGLNRLHKHQPRTGHLVGTVSVNTRKCAPHADFNAIMDRKKYRKDCHRGFENVFEMGTPENSSIIVLCIRRIQPGR